MKKLLNELDGISSISIGINNITNNFMTKYHENHSYENCRLLKINDHVSKNIWHDVLKKIGLDLLCVAVHYSKRYDNSDNLIENIMDDELKTYTNYIRYKTSKEIVDDFCNKYIQEDINDNNVILNVEWKNLHFVWKQFLSDNQYPNMIYSHNLKNLMMSKYKFDEEADTFYGITSKFIPIQREFINFWENTIQVKLNDNDEFDNELEIDEICGLFKIWIKHNNECKISSGNISEETILQIIKHYFSSIQIVEDKYFLNIICTLWNKINDISMSFEYIKEKNLHKEYSIVKRRLAINSQAKATFRTTTTSPASSSRKVVALLHRVHSLMRVVDVNLKYFRFLTKMLKENYSKK
jgi:hypothetical protein